MALHFRCFSHLSCLGKRCLAGLRLFYREIPELKTCQIGSRCGADTSICLHQCIKIGSNRSISNSKKYYRRVASLKRPRQKVTQFYFPRPSLKRTVLPGRPVSSTAVVDSPFPHMLLPAAPARGGLDRATGPVDGHKQRVCTPAGYIGHKLFFVFLHLKIFQISKYISVNLTQGFHFHH